MGFDSLCRPSPLGDSENKRKGTIVLSSGPYYGNGLDGLHFDCRSTESLHHRMMAGEVKEDEWSSGLQHGGDLICRFGATLVTYHQNGFVSSELAISAKVAAQAFRARTCQFVYYLDF